MNISIYMRWLLVFQILKLIQRLFKFLFYFSNQVHAYFMLMVSSIYEVHDEAKDKAFELEMS